MVAAGGCDYYPGSRTASPSFSFAVADVRVAGEGDLLAQLDRLRRTLHAEGLFEPQKQLDRPALPRCIGVVTGEGGKARDDVLAGLRRRGWGGRLVWAFAPVQDRHAAPAVTRALQDLAAIEDVDVVIVARGGGSLADLFAFCDETLCRTVALLRVPVIASVGHHTDRTLIDDVAAVALLDADARRRGGRAASTAARRGPGCAASPRAWSARAGARSSSAPGRSRGSRARPPTTWRATARGCTSSCASCARARAPRRSRRGGRSPPPPRRPTLLRAQGIAGRGRDAARRRDLERLASRSPRTTRSARSSAATRSSRTAPASRSRPPPPRASRSGSRCAWPTAAAGPSGSD